MADTLEDIAQTMGKARDFVKCNFLIGAVGVATVMSPPRKQALATWQSFYHSTINVPGQIVQQLLPLVRQCEAVDADSLKRNKIHLARQMCSLKLEFDTSFEKLLDKLNGLTGEILVKALGDNPLKKY